MKTTKLLLIVAAIMATAIAGWSQTTSGKKEPAQTNKGMAIIRKAKSGSAKKRTPSRQMIELSYDNGFIAVESSTYEGVLEIEFIDQQSGMVSADIEIATGQGINCYLDNGTYDVTAHGWDETEFAGELNIE